MRRLLPALLLTLPLSAQPPIDAQALIGRTRLSAPAWSPDGEWLTVTRSQVQWKSNRVDSHLELYWKGQHPPRHRLASAGQPRWSPDGSQLLFSQRGQLKIWSARNGVRAVKGAEECEAALWAPDGRHIAVVAPQGAPPQQDSGKLYDDLFLRRWNHYYDGRRRHLFLVDSRSGQKRQLTRGQRDAAPTSGAFSAQDNMAFSRDGRFLYFSAPPARGQASSTNYDVFQLDLASGREENLTLDNPAADLSPKIDARGRLWIASHTRPGYESDAFRLRSRDSGDSRWKIEAEGVHGEWHPSVRGLLVSQVDRGRSFFTLAGRRWGVESLHSLALQGHRWAGIVDGLDRPPEVVTGFLDSDVAAPLTPQQLPWRLGAVESLEVPVEGAAMQMWLIKPPDYRPERRYPCVVLIHGGPQGGWGNHWSLRWNPQVWAAQGYLVAMPNPRGSSGQGQAFQDQVSRDWGGLAYRDVLAGFEALRARPDVDGARMAAAGASFGGYMVNWLAVHDLPFRCYVTHCGVWNLESMYATTDELWFADWEFGGPPWRVPRPKDYDEFSPHRLAARLKTPHLVVHNDLDFRCPVDQGLQLFTALQLQGVPSRLLHFPDEGHWVVKPANSLRWHREVFDFVGTYLR